MRRAHSLALPVALLAMTASACRGDRGDEGDEGDAATGPTSLGEVEACASLDLDAPDGGTWTVEGPLGFDLPHATGAGWRYRVPVSVVEQALTLTHDSGASFTATIAAVPAPAGLADGMAPGCGPFSRGVASGDPGPDSVALWTRLDAAAAGTDAEIHWRISTSPAFEEDVASGTATASASADHTVQVDVDGLAPATTYYYRFALEPDDPNSWSVVGRTRTAPDGPSERLRFAVTSCTSIFSGYFNGYRAIARRLDLDGLIHVGDYTYDFADEDELVRIPDPLPPDPSTVEEWRTLHAYHLADPDLRAARAAHPWIMLWDNHDVNAGQPDFGGGVQAFREWNPVTRPRAADRPEVIYRKLPFGSLLDVFVIDILLFRDPGDAPDGPDKTLLGPEQEVWFEEQLAMSTARWKVVGNQKPVAPILGLLTVLGGATWNGYPDARVAFFDMLEQNGIDNVLMLSGDAHITAVTDLVSMPDDPVMYDPATGEGAVAAEFQPASMSRGNVDEFFPDMPQLPKGIEEGIGDTDPHYRFLDTTRHGYGILDIDASRIRGEVWYLDILERTDDETMGAALELRDGDNHWAR